MTNDLNNLINRYIDAWNEADGAPRELVAPSGPTTAPTSTR